MTTNCAGIRDACAGKGKGANSVYWAPKIQLFNILSFHLISFINSLYRVEFTERIDLRNWPVKAYLQYNLVTYIANYINH